MGLLPFNQILDLKAGLYHWEGKEHPCILNELRWLGY